MGHPTGVLSIVIYFPLDNSTCITLSNVYFFQEPFTRTNNLGGGIVKYETKLVLDTFGIKSSKFSC